MLNLFKNSMSCKSIAVSLSVLAVGLLSSTSLKVTYANVSNEFLVSNLTSEDLDEIDPNLQIEALENAPIQDGSNILGKAISENEMLIANFEVVLDRKGISPGAIDGALSDYLSHAVSAYNEKFETNLSLNDKRAIADFVLMAEKKSPLFVSYKITSKDVAGPFVGEIPKRIQDQADFEELGFQTIEEALAERFHMDEIFLKRLNPLIDFSKAGSEIKVANIGSALQTRVAAIKADMNGRRLYAFDKKGKIVAVYPASIGSPQNPSPRGSFKVRNKAGFPKYSLSPSNTFEPVDSGQTVVVAPGPNNPVGIAWIGLSKKSYGIHGTPWPERVGEAGSHGCIRLTNWDAMELTRLVRTGIKVEIE